MKNDRLFQMRVSKEFLEALDKWRDGKRPIPSRAEAARQIIFESLERAKKRK